MTSIKAIPARLGAELMSEQEVPSTDDDDQVQREKERDEPTPTETDPQEPAP
jgi:hypothetical protein